MAWSCGTSRQMIDVLHHACLTMSYSSINSVITALADRSIEQACLAASCPHALAYDNINISSSIFVEQGPNAMNKVQSRTFAVIYELCNACPEDMLIQPMVDMFKKSSPLAIIDLRPLISAMQSYLTHDSKCLPHPHKICWWLQRTRGTSNLAASNQTCTSHRPQFSTPFKPQPLKRRALTETSLYIMMCISFN